MPQFIPLMVMAVLLLMDIWFIYSFRLLPRFCLEILIHVSWYANACIFLAMHPGIGLLCPEFWGLQLGWKMQTVFQSNCTEFYSHQQCGKAPIPPHPSQHLSLSDFLFWHSWCMWHWLFSIWFNLHLLIITERSIFAYSYRLSGFPFCSFFNWVIGLFFNWFVDVSSLWIMCCKCHLILWLVFSHSLKWCLFMNLIPLMSF